MWDLVRFSEIQPKRHHTCRKHSFGSWILTVMLKFPTFYTFNLIWHQNKNHILITWRDVLWTRPLKLQKYPIGSWSVPSGVKHSNHLQLSFSLRVHLSLSKTKYISECGFITHLNIFIYILFVFVLFCCFSRKPDYNTFRPVSLSACAHE